MAEKWSEKYFRQAFGVSVKEHLDELTKRDQRYIEEKREEIARQREVMEAVDAVEVEESKKGHTSKTIAHAGRKKLAEIVEPKLAEYAAEVEKRREASIAKLTDSLEKLDRFENDHKFSDLSKNDVIEKQRRIAKLVSHVAETSPDRVTKELADSAGEMRKHPSLKNAEQFIGSSVEHFQQRAVAVESAERAAHRSSFEREEDKRLTFLSYQRDAYKLEMDTKLEELRQPIEKRQGIAGIKDAILGVNLRAEREREMEIDKITRQRDRKLAEFDKKEKTEKVVPTEFRESKDLVDLRRAAGFQHEQREVVAQLNELDQQPKNTIMSEKQTASVRRVMSPEQFSDMYVNGTAKGYEFQGYEPTLEEQYKISELKKQMREQEQAKSPVKAAQDERIEFTDGRQQQKVVAHKTEPAEKIAFEDARVQQSAKTEATAEEVIEFADARVQQQERKDVLVAAAEPATQSKSDQMVTEQVPANAVTVADLIKQSQQAAGQHQGQQEVEQQKTAAQLVAPVKEEQVEVASDSTRRPIVKGPEKIGRFERQADGGYAKPGEKAVIHDLGEHKGVTAIVSSEDKARREVISAAAELCKQKGMTSVRITARKPETRSAMYVEAAARGMQCKGYEPTAEDLKAVEARQDQLGKIEAMKALNSRTQQMQTQQLERKREEGMTQ